MGNITRNAYIKTWVITLFKNQLLMKTIFYSNGTHRSRQNDSHLLFWCLLLMAFIYTAPAYATALTTGDTTKNGSYGITLVAPDKSTLRLSVRGIVKGTSAVNKAKLIAGKVTGLSWRVSRTGSTLSFEHSENGKWVKVKELEDPFDSTGEKEKYTALAFGGVFEFDLSQTIAEGLDGDNSASFASISTSLGASIFNINPGDTATLIIDSLFTGLSNIPNMDILRLTATSFRIIDPSPSAFMAFQVTDNFLSVVGGSARSFIPEPSVLFLMIIGIISMTMLRGTNFSLRKKRF